MKQVSDGRFDMYPNIKSDRDEISKAVQSLIEKGYIKNTTGAYSLTKKGEEVIVE